MAILIKNGTLVTLNKNRDIKKADLLIEKQIIKKIARTIKPTSNMRVVDANNQFVIPGFIQAHTHLVQVLFRGYADDMSLIHWLKKRIWPMEHHHNTNSIRASAKLGLLEMQKYGTTSILDMATIQHTDDVFEEVKKSKIRYWGGKCLMDIKNSTGLLHEKKAPALKETEGLIKKWHNHNDLITYVLNPRFVLSCSEGLLKDIKEFQRQYKMIIHTHASENLEEVNLVKKRTGLHNIHYLDKLKYLNKQTVIAHGVHVSDSELNRLIDTKTSIVHCPSANLKLASGIAPITVYANKNLNIALGSDGAPCNNTMDPFMEMRLAALIQKPRYGPKALPALQAFEMATLNGAKALGMEDQLGSLEVGKLADIATVDRSHPSVCTVGDPYSALVYSCSGRDVKHVFVNGRQVIKNQKHLFIDEESTISQAKKELFKLLKRI